jgi:hypothetical protein
MQKVHTWACGVQTCSLAYSGHQIRADKSQPHKEQYTRTERAAQRERENKQGQNRNKKAVDMKTKNRKREKNKKSVKVM